MRFYHLMTLHASELLKTYELQKSRENAGNTPAFCFDIKTIQTFILKSTDRHKDNAMFDQVIRSLCESSGGSDPEQMKEDADCLLRHLLFLDFGSVFNDTKKSGKAEEHEDRLRLLFESGFSIRYDDDPVKSYVPFDKSSSMAREKRMSFIDRDLFEQLDDRIRMGIIKPETMVVPSKYYAYRGLLFSDGYRIEEQNGFALNEKTVLVLKDDSHTIEEGLFLSAKATDDADQGKYEPDEIDILVAPEKKKDIKDKKERKIKGFDGEGICSPEFASCLNAELRKHDNVSFMQDAVSFQIRIPYGKGMLHQVDFQQILREQLQVDDLSDVRIKDVFGIERCLDDIRVILSESMLKCCDWLKSLKKTGEQPDPMKFYFDRFHRYQYALYVIRTDCSLSHERRVKFNYQFWNTLAISGKKFDALVQRHIHEACSITKKGNGFGADYAEYLADTLFEKSPSRPAWQYALGMNPAFVKDPYIRGRLERARNDSMCDIAEGKIYVNGIQLFLSDDLLHFMVHIVKSIVDVKNRNDIIRKLKGQCVSKEHFYTPLASGYGLEGGKRYTLWRSPHLSRSEQCAPRAFIHRENDLYDRYFSHLTGVLMLSYKSTDALVLGGADYDGDIVKLIWEKSIVDGVKEGAYIVSGKDYKRRYRTVMIPDLSKGKKDQKEQAADRIDLYELTKNTFSNRIGLISNKAIEIGLKEYGKQNGVKETDPCAECTLATGMEIDAVKTGIRPDLDHLLSHNGAYEMPAYLTLGKEISRFRNHSYIAKVESLTGEDGLEWYQVRDIKAAFYPPDSDEPILDRLPGYALSGLRQRKEKEEVNDTGKQPGCDALFVFRQDANREEAVASEDVTDQLKQLVEAYHAVRKIASEAIKARMENEAEQEILRRKILTLMMLSFPAESFSDLLSHYDRTFWDLQNCLGDYDKAKTARDNMTELRWAFTGSESRRSVLYQILPTGGLSDVAEKVLLSDSPDAYNLLNFFLRLTETSFRNMAKDLSVKEETNLSRDREELYQTWMKLSPQKPTVELWREKAVAYCREKLDTLFEGDYDMALRCYDAMAKKHDRDRRFLWEVFRTEEIIRNISTGRDRERLDHVK